MRGYSWHRILGSPWLRVQRLFHHGTELWLTWHGPKNCPEVTFYESQSIFIITKHIERKQHHFFFRFLLLGQISGRRHFQDEIGPKTGDHPNSMLQSVCFSLEPCCGRGPSYWTCKKKRFMTSLTHKICAGYLVMCPELAVKHGRFSHQVHQTHFWHFPLSPKGRRKSIPPQKMGKNNTPTKNMVIKCNKLLFIFFWGGYYTKNDKSTSAFFPCWLVLHLTNCRSHRRDVIRRIGRVSLLFFLVSSCRDSCDIYIYIYIYIFHIHIYIYTYTYIFFIYIYVYIHTYIYIYIHIYI